MLFHYLKTAINTHNEWRDKKKQKQIIALILP